MSRLIIGVIILWHVASANSFGMNEQLTLAPSPEALCVAMLAIVGWNDIKESANETNSDRVRAAGLIRLMGLKLLQTQPHLSSRFPLFFQPQPGVPHSLIVRPTPENVATASTLLGAKPIPEDVLLRLHELLFDGRTNWKSTRYFFVPIDSLYVAEIASMWQRHARNLPALQESAVENFGGDLVLSEVQRVIQRHYEHSYEFWAYMGFDTTVQLFDDKTILMLSNHAPGFRNQIRVGERVRIDYLLSFDSDPLVPRGMLVVLRFPDEER